MDISAYGVKQIYRMGLDGKPVIDPRTRRPIVEREEYYIDRLAPYVKPYVIVPRNADLNPTNPEQIVVPASGQSADVPLFMWDEGLFEGAYLTAQYADDANPQLLVELIDNQRKVSLTGRPCHVETLIGVGQRPFILPESIVIDKKQPVTARFIDLSTAENNVRLQVHGQRLYSEQIRDPRLDRYIKRRRERNRFMSFYACPLDTDPSIAGNGEGDYYFTQDSLSYFEVRKIAVKSTSTFKYKVTDEKSNGLQTDWIHATGAVGTGQYPFIFAGPWLVEPGGKLTFRIKDLSGSTNKIYMTLSGRQHFVVPGP